LVLNIPDCPQLLEQHYVSCQSAASERNFSLAGHVVNSRRTRLNGSSVNDILFVNSALHWTLFLNSPEYVYVYKNMYMAWMEYCILYMNIKYHTGMWYYMDCKHLPIVTHMHINWHVRVLIGMCGYSLTCAGNMRVM